MLNTTASADQFQDDTVLAEINVHDIRRMNYMNGVAFINSMIPEQLDLEVPELHEVVFYKMTKSSNQVALALPRGTAKTTLIKLGGIWHLIYTDHFYVIYVSSTHGKAVNYVRDMINTMKSENYRQIYGGIDFVLEQNAMGLYQFWMNKILYDADGNEVVKRVKVTIQCRGAQQDVRGLNIDNKRPSLGLFDDIESKESLSKGEHNYKNLKTWFMGTLGKAFDKRKKKLIQIGNLVSDPSVLNDNLLSDSWESMRFGIVDAKGNSIWKELWPLEEIMADFKDFLAENQIATWYAEMMNFPMPPSGGLIRIDEIKFVPVIRHDEGQFLYTFITVDLAISSKSWAHKTAVAVHAFDGTRWVITETVAQSGLDPIALFHLLAKLGTKWNTNYVGIEAVAYQAALIPIYTYLSQLAEFDQLIFVPVPAINRKTERLFAWAGLLKTGVYALPINQQGIVNELTKYDPTKTSNDDDTIDCCAHGNYMISKFGHEIAQGFRENVTGQSQVLIPPTAKPITNFHL